MGLFDRVEAAIKAFQNRKFVILLSESEREADLCVPAAEITGDSLPSRYQATDTPFYSSVDAATGIGSGISPKDRAATVRKVINGETKPQDLARPGHVHLLGADPLGLLKRDGHTEAVVQLCELAGLYPAGVLCEIIGSSGDMATAKELKKLAKDLRIPIITIGALAKFARAFLPKKKSGT